jgi:hypothetical protein
MKHNTTVCEKPFWEDPMVIINNFNLNYCNKCPQQLYNFIVRLFIIAVITSALFVTSGYGVVVVPVVFFVIILMGTLIILSRLYGLHLDDSVVPDIMLGDGDYQELPLTNVVLPTDNSGNKINSKGEFGPTRADMKMLAKQTADFIQSQEVLRGYNMMTTPATTGGQPLKEGFVGMGPGSEMGGKMLGLSGIGAAPYQANSPLPDITLPAARNPFMNILLDEYKYNPTRPTAAPLTDPLIKTTMDDFFRVQWFSDPTDVFGRNQNQRQFISQAVTSVPNDQKSFQEWLYKIPGKTCKEGNPAACLPGTDGSPVTWLNQQY